MDKYWKKNVLLNKTVANNLSLCVKNDGSNAKKGVSKSNVPTTHGFGANVLRFQRPSAVTVFAHKPLLINQKYTFAATTSGTER